MISIQCVETIWNAFELKKKEEEKEESSLPLNTNLDHMAQITRTGDAFR